MTSRLNGRRRGEKENCCVATEQIGVPVKPSSSNLPPLIKTQQTGMTHFAVRPCFDVRLQPACPNGIAAAGGGQRFEMGQEGGVGGAPAEIGDWTDVCLLSFEAGTHVSERVW